MKTLDILLDLQREQRANHQELSAAVTTGLAQVHEVLAAHTLADVAQFAALDKRLAPIESLRTTARWATGAGFVASLGIVADFIYTYFHRP